MKATNDRKCISISCTEGLGTWKKPCDMKFVLVGLFCGPLLALIPPLTQAKNRGSGNRVSDFRVSGGPPVICYQI